MNHGIKPIEKVATDVAEIIVPRNQYIPHYFQLFVRRLSTDTELLCRVVPPERIVPADARTRGPECRLSRCSGACDRSREVTDTGPIWSCVTASGNLNAIGKT